MPRPLIAINCDVATVHRVRAQCYLDNADMVLRAGGDPLLLPPMADENGYLERMLDRVDGLVLVGGDDIPPEDMRQELHPRSEPVHPRRAGFDRRLVPAALARELPVLGICLGAQQINVFRGGEHVQHVPERYGESLRHFSGERGVWVEHPVRVDGGSLLAQVLGRTELVVRGGHHQAVGSPGAGLDVVAHAPDGVVEGIEDPSRPFLLGVQWHPETMPDAPEQLRLFQALVSAASGRAH